MDNQLAPTRAAAGFATKWRKNPIRTGRTALTTTDRSLSNHRRPVRPPHHPGRVRFSQDKAARSPLPPSQSGGEQNALSISRRLAGLGLRFAFRVAEMWRTQSILLSLSYPLTIHTSPRANSKPITATHNFSSREDFSYARLSMVTAPFRMRGGAGASLTASWLLATHESIIHHAVGSHHR